MKATPTSVLSKELKWYFAWILGTLLACAFGIITAPGINAEAGKTGQEEKLMTHIIAKLYAV
ncbi:cytochrome bd-I oxidase subunit CydX [Salmonella enterica subsp. enterica]|nr:cytochrome bd-I oxidase subunit CydX [Salmonella enterica subsp. enterica]